MVNGADGHSQPRRNHKRVSASWTGIGHMIKESKWADKERSGLIAGEWAGEDEVDHRNFYSRENETSDSGSCYFMSVFCEIMRNTFYY
ncbi:hypothetical protein EVAR_45471_1 [Eumeta japonica]|uniref:Uncharacterized protein n=1 Tax=Eumeta variegata TaxID=151549 RepID=A0A4C1WH94_EUMVA|nr:hypothetical protein EVAR_45471_1 [Eumeta japonica]